METEPSSQAVVQSGQPPAVFSCRVWICLLGWFFGWPATMFAIIALITRPHWLFLFPFAIGSLLWIIAGYCICNGLLLMAETRWPAMKPIREIIGFIFALLRSLHHAP
jgi:hypothetical protein